MNIMLCPVGESICWRKNNCEILLLDTKLINIALRKQPYIFKRKREQCSKVFEIGKCNIIEINQNAYQ